MSYTTTVTQKITSTDDTEIATPSEFKNLSMMTLANTHSANAVVVDLYLEYVTNTTSTIVSTGDYAAEAEAVSVTSTVLTIDDGSAGDAAPTNDVYLNKRVYKSDATLFGTCTAFSDSSTDTITFGAGVLSAIAENVLLYTPTKYYIIKTVSIPAGVTLKLDRDEINFNQDELSMYINCSVADVVDVITRPI